MYTNRRVIKRNPPRIRFAHGGLEGRRYSEGAMLYLKTGFSLVYAMNVAADCRRYSEGAMLYLKTGFFPVYAMNVAADCRRYGDVRGGTAFYAV
ncbi:MAG: hypothetical protein II875_12435, partial [Clostridia bacterium]|nr:hypothetical protein [Clostridia bacterium]